MSAVTVLSTITGIYYYAQILCLKILITATQPLCKYKINISK
jgi:hypothetical protein